MTGRFTVVVAVVALVAARSGLGTAGPAADFEPPHRLFGGAALRVVNQAGPKPTPALSSALRLQNPTAMVMGIVRRSLGAGLVRVRTQSTHTRGDKR